MSRIRGADTSPETRLREALSKARLVFDPEAKAPHARPDVIFAAKCVAVFVDGCFWHGCPEHYTRPGSREDFWAGKLRENTARDRKQTLALETAGWRVIRLWEHEVFTALDASVGLVAAALETSTWQPSLRDVVVRVELLDPVSRLERHHLEDLRDPGVARATERTRSTRKWKRPTP